MKPVPISHARASGRASGAHRVAIVYVDRDGRFGVTTWGETKADCRALAAWAESDAAVTVAGQVRDADG